MHSDDRESMLLFLRLWLTEAIENCRNFLEAEGAQRVDHRSIFQEHYLLTSVAMSFRYAKRINDHSPEPQKNKDFENFLAATSDAIEVRDMREHSDEYFLGIGRKQNQFFKGSSDQIACDMSASVRDKRGYMLGNLIAIEKIEGECQRLLSALPPDD